MLILNKDWTRMSYYLQEIRGLLNELSDEELEHLKKRCSDLPVSQRKASIGTNIRG
tara:strand:- start:215 stop:382 length:168 start_codon:yes stop_codon:yes gene_type:complete